MNRDYTTGDIVLGNWQLVRQIGQGSFGTVFEARREEFGVTYRAAIKIITIPQSQSEIQSARVEGMDDMSLTAYFRGIVEEIVQEYILMSKLKGNSHVVSYEDHAVIHDENDICWHIVIRMELLTPLLDYVQSHTLTRKDVIKLGIDICKALELCQKYNIIHRDIKPENIFLSDLGKYKLGDFGIARAVDRTIGVLSKKGTYTYMAPEVYKEEEYNSSVDIYSLGIVMYRLLNDNRAPFLPAYPSPIKHSDRESALVKRISGVSLPAPKNASGRLAEIVLKACAYSPKDRYSSPIQMRQELEAILYNQVEAHVIYPDGDQTPIRTVENIPTNQEDMSDAKTGEVSDYSIAECFSETRTMYAENMFAEETEPLCTARGAAAYAQTEMQVSNEEGRNKRKYKRIAALFIAGCLLGGALLAVRYQVVQQQQDQAKMEQIVAAKEILSCDTEQITLKKGETEQIPFTLKQELQFANGEIETKDLLADAAASSEGISRWVEFAVEDTNIATVNATGLVTAVKAGTTAVNVSLSGDIQQSYSVVLNVEPLVEEWRVEGYEAASPHKEYERLYWDGEATSQVRYTGRTMPTEITQPNTGQSVSDTQSNWSYTSPSSQSGSGGTDASGSSPQPESSSSDELEIYIPSEDSGDMPSDITANY